MRILSGYQKPITALAVSLDGKRLYSAAQTQTMIWVWDLTDGTQLTKLRGQHPDKGICELMRSPNGEQLVASGASRGLAVWDLTTQRQAAYIDERTEPRGVAIDANSRVAAFMSWEGSLRSRPIQIRCGIQLWDLHEGKRLRWLYLSDEVLSTLAFLPTGERIAGGMRGRNIHFWNYQTGALTHIVRYPGKGLMERFSFRPDGKHLAIVTPAYGNILDLSSGEIIHTQTGHLEPLCAFEYSPDGKYIASAGADGIVCLHDGQTFERLGKRHLEIGKLGAMCWLPDSSGLVAGGEKLIAVCDLADLHGTDRANPKLRGEPLSLAGHTNSVTNLAYSPDGCTLCSQDKMQVRLWDLSGGAGQASAKEDVSANLVDLSPNGNPWSPDGKRLLFCTYHDVRLFEASTGKLIRVITIPTEGSVFLSSYTPTGRIVLVWGTANVGGRDLYLELRDEEGIVLSSTNGTSALYYSANRLYIPGHEDHGVYLSGLGCVALWWPIENQVIRLFNQTNSTVGLVVSADGKHLLTVGGQTTAVRQMNNLNRPINLKHPLLCSAAAFLPGDRVLTSCYDGIVRIWDLTSRSELFAFDLGMGRVHSLAVSPDHMTFAAGVQKQNRIVLMDIPD